MIMARRYWGILGDLDFDDLGERETFPEMEIYKYSEVKKRMASRLNAYKEYTNVRDESEDLFINNTEYVEDMADEHWGNISEVF